MGKSKSLRGLRTKRRDFRVAYDERITQREDKLVKERILANSIAEEWEEARREWEFIGMIQEDEHDNLERFTDSCELCNQPGLRRNYEISNPGTGKKFLVGSTCIKKFLLLKGAESQEHSAAIFDLQVKQMIAAKKLQELIPSILERPTMYEAHAFRNASKDILGTLDNLLIKRDIWENYVKMVLGPKPNPKALDKVRVVLFQPSKIVYKKVKDLSTGEEEGRWAGKAKVKTRVETTLVRSRGDRPD
ncbi:MAG: hypothetical protein AB1796_04645 [Bacillota bacterium]